MIKIFDIFFNLDKYLSLAIQNYGVFVYLLLFLIIFLETGLVITPFLPGDSLLFVSGALAAAGSLNLAFLLLLMAFAAIIGDTVNYWMGNYFGEKVFSKFIKKEHLERTKSFYEKYGAKTIVLARFVPIIRTFAPFVAGIGKMKYGTFLTYNVIGGISWVVLFVLAGYFFGSIDFVKNNLTIVILLIVVVSIIPIVIEYLKHQKTQI